MAKANGKDVVAPLLGDLRLIRSKPEKLITQKQIADKLGIAQSEISRLEERGDFRLSTVRKYVEKGLGGKLELFATFEDGVKVKLA